MIVNFAELSQLRGRHSEENIVFTGGCFDLFHEGHIERLKFCRDVGDIAVVGVVSDARVRERKGGSRPLRPEAARLAVVDAVRYVDYSFIMPMPDGIASPTLQVIQSLRPDSFVEHATESHRWEKDMDLLRLLGTELLVDNGPKLNSTTALAERLSVGHG